MTAQTCISPINQWQSNDHTERYTFDRNGSPASLSRRYNGTLIDSLNYSYQYHNGTGTVSSGNRLANVRDLATPTTEPPSGFRDNGSVNTSTSEYTYSPAGAIISDAQLGLTIAYSHLAQPTQLTKGTGASQRRVCYTYAGGVRVREVHLQGTGTDTTQLTWQFAEFRFTQRDLYLGFLDYTTQITYPGGLTSDSADGTGEWADRLALQDLKGSSRAVLDGGIALQYMHYYPGGLQNGTSVANVGGDPLFQKFHQGQQAIEGIGIFWQDHGARMANLVLNTWSATDPLAHQAPFQSTYNYMGADPVNRVDPGGRSDGWVGSLDRLAYMYGNHDSPGWSGTVGLFFQQGGQWRTHQISSLEGSGGTGGGGANSDRNSLRFNSLVDMHVYVVKHGGTLVSNGDGTFRHVADGGTVGTVGSSGEWVTVTEQRLHRRGFLGLGGANGSSGNKWARYKLVTKRVWVNHASYVNENTSSTFDNQQSGFKIWAVNDKDFGGIVGHLGVIFESPDGGLKLYSRNGTYFSWRTFGSFSGPQDHADVGRDFGNWDVFQWWNGFEDKGYDRAFGIEIDEKHFTQAQTYAESHANDWYFLTVSDCNTLVEQVFYLAGINVDASLWPNVEYNLIKRSRYPGTEIKFK